VKFAQTEYSRDLGIPKGQSRNPGIENQVPNGPGLLLMSELLHWKTEPAGLFITRDRLAANAAHAACTRIELKWLIEITGLAKKSKPT